MKTKEGTCEMCGHSVAIRLKARIFAEGKKSGSNILMLCPTCHLMFDTHLKPKIFKALTEAGVKDLPASWRKSIYALDAEASAKARGKTKV
jgi:hypothetical protein